MAETALMRVEVVSPERVLYSGDATQVITRTLGGGEIAFIGKELDQTGGPREPRWVEQIQKARPDAVISIMQPGSLQFLHFNMKVKPLDDVRVRKAIAYAVDRRVWKSVFGVVHGPLPAIVPEEFYGALKTSEIPAELRYDFDLAKAKALQESV